MTSGHLITYTNLTFFSNIYFRHLNDTCRQFITDCDSELFTLQFSIKFFVLLDKVQDQVTNHTIRMIIIGPVAQLNRSEIKWIEVRSTKLRAFSYDFSSQVVFHALRYLSFCQYHQFLYQDTFQVSYLRLKFIVNFRKQRLISQLRTTILDDTWEQFLINNYPLQRRRCFQRSIFHITSLITEDCTKQFFFRRRIRFTFRCNLTNQYITRLNTCTDTYDTILVQILSGFLTHVRNIRSQLFHSSLGFTNFEWILFYVYWSQQVFTNHTFIQHDSILVIITFPRHVSNQQILTQSEFSIFSRITFCQNLTFRHTITFIASWPKVDCHILVRFTELRYSIFF